MRTKSTRRKQDGDVRNGEGTDFRGQRVNQKHKKLLKAAITAYYLIITTIYKVPVIVYINIQWSVINHWYCADLCVCVCVCVSLCVQACV